MVNVQLHILDDVVLVNESKLIEIQVKSEEVRVTSADLQVKGKGTLSENIFFRSESCQEVPLPRRRQRVASRVSSKESKDAQTINYWKVDTFHCHISNFFSLRIFLFYSLKIKAFLFLFFQIQHYLCSSSFMIELRDKMNNLLRLKIEISKFNFISH